MRSFCHCFVHFEGIVEGLQEQCSFRLWELLSVYATSQKFGNMLLISWLFFHFHDYLHCNGHVWENALN